MKFISRCPLFLFVLIAYNIAMWSSPHLISGREDAVVVVEETAEPVQPEDAEAQLDAQQEEVRYFPPPPLFTVDLMSGATWRPTLSDFILLFAIAVLYIELFKSTRTSVGAIVEHVFSLFVFIVFLVEFLLVPAAGTSTFLLVTLLSLIDVIGGFTITISTARRDFGVGSHAMPE